MENALENSREIDDALILTGCVIFCVIVAFCVFYAPMYMDEAGYFHVLACINHPFSVYNMFREQCFQKNDLTLFGGFTITRDAFYEGAMSSVLYSPFYFIFRAPYAQYIYSLSLFAAFVGFVSRFTKNPRLSAALLASFFPLVFQFVHDSGPVKFAALVFPLAAILFRKMVLSASAARYVYSILLAGLIILAVEDKPFLIYLLPGIIFFSLAVLAEGRSFKELFGLIERAMPALVATGVLTLIGLFFLMFSTNVAGHYYIYWLMDMARTSRSLSTWAYSLFIYVFFWPMYGHEVFIVDGNSSWSLFFKVTTFLFLGFFIFRCIKTKILEQPKLILLLASLFSTLIVFAFLRNTEHGHHFIFLWIPSLVLFAEVVATQKDGMRSAVVLPFLLLNIAAPLALTQVPIHTETAKEREAIFAYFNDEKIASNAIINFTSWGGYFIQALYGPKTQLVTYTEPFEDVRPAPLYPAFAAKLLEISALTNRTIYNVCFGPVCTKEDLEKAFDHRVLFEEVMPGLQAWRVFKAVPIQLPKAS